ncbi:hypothetical protein MTBSS4_700006 [Magnetospirillum sp. SS-4]|nr:hypothetical protein MTBSS4_700006 [Magnetospirillum sp. SS-4]
MDLLIAFNNDPIRSYAGGLFFQSPHCKRKIFFLARDLQAKSTFNVETRQSAKSVHLHICHPPGINYSYRFELEVWLRQKNFHIFWAYLGITLNATKYMRRIRYAIRHGWSCA